MTLLTLFAKKEPTVDVISTHYGQARKQDTVLYRDARCADVVARWPWQYSTCPRRGQRRVVLNCYRWDLSWCN